MCDLDYGYMGFTRNIIKIKGKTYQNLLSETKSLGKFVYDESTGEYTLTNPESGKWNPININYTRPIQAGEKLLIRINFVKNTIESTQSPSIKITFSDDSSSTKGFINVENNFTGLLEYYCNGAIVNETYRNIFQISTRNYSSGELVIKDIQVIPLSENLLLNNIELPTSINGIESACENENNVLLLKDNSITLHQPLRSLPNGVCDEIKGNKLIQRVGIQRLDGSENWTKHTNLSYNNMSLFYLVNPNINKTSHIGISSKLPCYDKTERGNCLDNKKECIILSDDTTGLVQIILKNTSLETQDASGLKKYLAANPITLFYELATPIEHTINVNIKKIKKSKCYNNIKPTII